MNWQTMIKNMKYSERRRHYVHSISPRRIIEIAQLLVTFDITLDIFILSLHIKYGLE
jgi:hypothetical protein